MHGSCVCCVKARRVAGVGTHGEYLVGGRPLYQKLQLHGFNVDGRSTERPYNRYSSLRLTTDALRLDTIRAFLQGDVSL